MASFILTLIYLLTAIGLTLGGSSTIHMYTQTIYSTTQLTSLVGGFLGFEPRELKLIGKSVGHASSLQRRVREEYPAFILSMSEFDFIQNPCYLTAYR